MSEPESEPTVDPEVAAVAESAIPVSAEPPPWRIRHRLTFRLIVGVIILWLIGMAVLMMFKHL